MLYALNWIVVALLLVLWSLAVWALHAVAIWTVSNAGALTGSASGAEGLRLPDWLAAWVPPESSQALISLASDVGRVVDSLFRSAPDLSSGLTVATWLVWGAGAVLLVLLGAGLHLLIVMSRRRGGGVGSQPARVPSTN